MTRFQDSKASIRELFFLTGMPKSGTTWMMNILNCLPNVFCLGEGRFFSSGLDNVPSLYEAVFNALYPWYEYISLRKNNWLALDEAIQTINRYNYLPHNVLHEAFQEDMGTLMKLAISHFMERAVQGSAGIKFVGDKTPVTEPVQVWWMNSIFPNARILFMHRNVKDFIVSLIFHYWRSVRDRRPDRNMSLLNRDDFLRAERFLHSIGEHSYDFVSQETAVRLAKQWLLTNREAEKIAERDSKALKIISYEHLLEKPESVMQEVFSYLELDIDHSTTKNILKHSSIESIMQSENAALKAHIRSGKPGDWVNYLSEEISQIIDQVLQAPDNSK